MPGKTRVTLFRFGGLVWLAGGEKRFCVAKGAPGHGVHTPALADGALHPSSGDLGEAAFPPAK